MNLLKEHYNLLFNTYQYYQIQNNNHIYLFYHKFIKYLFYMY